MIKEKVGNYNIGSFNDLYKSYEGFFFVTQKFEQNKNNLLKQIIEESKEHKTLAPKTPEQLIEKRKKEYQKLEAKDKELIVNTFGAFIGIKEGKIAIRYKNEKDKIFSLANIHHITILTNGISMSSDFIYQCSVNFIPVSFFTAKGEHYSTLYTPNHTDNTIWIKQLEVASSDKGVKIAVLLIQAKIRNQINLLKYFHKYHKKADAGFATLFATEINKLTALSKKCVQYHYDADYRTQLMGIESQAAVIYWELIAELINDDSDFAGRERKGAKDLVNCLLNYGYAILYARIWQAILIAKLNPYISFIHLPNDSKPTLAYDLIEMFRQQAVDRVVISLLQKKEKLSIEKGLLDNKTRAKLIQNIYERFHRYEKYRGENRRFSEIIKIQIKAFSDYITDDCKTFKPYISKW